MPARRDHARFITLARTALTNARDDADIQPLLAPFGYDPARLDDGLALVDAAEAAMQGQQTEYAEQYAATDDLNEAIGAMQATYIRHVKLARVAFKPDTEGYLKLGLRGERPRATPDLIATARAFYDTLLTTPPLLNAMSTLTVDQPAAQAARAQVEAVDAALQTQQTQTGDAQMGTRQRDDAVADARGFFSDFVAVVKIALGDHPQLRERLGLLERS